MHTINANLARTVKLARAAGALSGVAFISADRTPEQANAFTAFNASCVKHSFDPASTYADASTADPVRKHRADAKPNAAKPEAAKPEAPKAAKPQPKPAKPSKPADTSRADAYAERVAIIGELRVAVSAQYNGPSLAVRTNPKRYPSSVYSDLLATPKHRTDLARISARDESALMLIIKRGERNGSFDPVNLNLDSGIFSRLASVGFIAADGPGAFKLSPDAIAYCKLIAKRAA